MTAQAEKLAGRLKLASPPDLDDDKEQAEELDDDQAQADTAGGDGQDKAEVTYQRDSRGRVMIGADPAHVAEILRWAIGSRELAGVFRRSGELVHTPRVGEEGYIPPKDPAQDLGPAQVQPFTTGQLKALAGHVYCFVGTSKGKEFETLAPMAGVADAYELARMGLAPNLRELRGVTHTPAMRPDGSVLDRPGYDQATGYLYLPDAGLDVPPIPDEPTAAELEQARDELLGLVDEVPWVNDDNQATWLGLAMTPILRAVLHGPYPLGLFTAPNPGSGKSRLAAIIRKLHGGVLRGDLPVDKDELRKQITATLVDTTAPVVTWDNLTGVVRSPVLEALLTTDTWSDRYLGHSRTVNAANDRLWLATGNNATIGGDLPRRVLVVEIDPGIPNPHLRTEWKIQDLGQYLSLHRGQLLAAMLTIARHWHVQGRPEDRDRGDDYAAWAGALRAMLAMAKVPGRFGGETSTIASKVDPETLEWAEFLREVHRVKGAEPFTVKELVHALATIPDSAMDAFKATHVDSHTLPGDLAHKFAAVREGNTAGFSRSLGLWLRNRTGRYAEGWKIEGRADAHGASYHVAAPP